ncbi:MAG: hypothetical protein RH860_11715 [Cytophagales bacterium]
MNNKFLYIASLLVFGACNNPSEKLIAENQLKMDSLQSIINDNNYSLALLDQMGRYLDTIEANRNYVVIDLEMGMTEENYIDRMKNLNLYTQKAEWTIGELEKTRSAYASQVKRLKAQISEMEKMNEQLQLKVAQFQAKNADIESQLTISMEQLSEAKEEIAMKDINLKQKENELVDALNKVVLTEAEIYFAKGEGMESVADHMQFAPKRKKSNLEEALKNYDKSLAMGYEPAKERIAIVKSKLKI